MDPRIKEGGYPLKLVDQLFAETTTNKLNPPLHWGDVEALQHAYSFDDPLVISLSRFNLDEIKAKLNGKFPGGSVDGKGGAEHVDVNTEGREDEGTDTTESKSGSEPPLPFVCSFRCFIRMPQNPEPFIGAYKYRGEWRTTKYRDEIRENSDGFEETVLWERLPFRCCIIPGALPRCACTSVISDDKREGKDVAEVNTYNKDDKCMRDITVLLYPPFSLLGNHIGQNDNQKCRHVQLKINDVIDVIGIASFANVKQDAYIPISNLVNCRCASETRAAENPWALRLHAFGVRVLGGSDYMGSRTLALPPLVHSTREFYRQRTLDILQRCFMGDRIAAEYALIFLCSRVTSGTAPHSPHPLLPGRLRLAFLFPTNFNTNRDVATETIEEKKTKSNKKTITKINDACCCDILSKTAIDVVDTFRSLVSVVTGVSVDPYFLVRQNFCSSTRCSSNVQEDEFFHHGILQAAPNSILVVDEPTELNTTVLEKAAAAATTEMQRENQQQEWDQDRQEQQQNQEKGEQSGQHQHQKQEHPQKDKQQQKDLTEGFLERAKDNILAIDNMMWSSEVSHTFEGRPHPIPVSTESIIIVNGHRRPSVASIGILEVPVHPDYPNDETETDAHSKTGNLNLNYIQHKDDPFNKDDLLEIQNFISSVKNRGKPKIDANTQNKIIDSFVQNRKDSPLVKEEDLQAWMLMAEAEAAIEGSIDIEAEGPETVTTETTTSSTTIDTATDDGIAKATASEYLTTTESVTKKSVSLPDASEDITATLPLSNTNRNKGTGDIITDCQVIAITTKHWDRIMTLENIRRNRIEVMQKNICEKNNRNKINQNTVEVDLHTAIETKLQI